MARRKDNLLKDIMDLLMVLPWWCSPIASIIAYVGLGSILPTLLPVENPLFLGISRGLPHLAVFFALGAPDTNAIRFLQYSTQETVTGCTKWH